MSTSHSGYSVLCSIHVKMTGGIKSYARYGMTGFQSESGFIGRIILEFRKVLSAANTTGIVRHRECEWASLQNKCALLLCSGRKAGKSHPQRTTARVALFTG